MIFLPDVNVWLALASARHAHSARCSEWLASVGQEEALFCRITQMSLLRLLTNAAVMGTDVLTPRQAWRTYAAMISDDRIGFAPEPLAVESHWRKLTAVDQPTPKLWSNAYLAAFAQSATLRLVTLDRAVLQIAPGALLLTPVS